MAASAAFSVMGGVAQVRWPARLSFLRSGLELRPSVFLPGWRQISAHGVDAGSGGAAGFGFNLDGVRATGCGSFVPMSGGKVSARWILTVERKVAVEQVYLTTVIPGIVRDGGSYVTDGVSKRFPSRGAEFQFGFSGCARRLSLSDAEGRIRATLSFDSPVRMMFQDDAKFGGETSLRVMLPEKELLPGRLYGWGVSVSEDEPVSVDELRPLAIEANENWIPLVSPTGGIVAGSALDFSAVSGIDAPAGKHGRVVVRNGHFEFSGLPGVPQRFYGVNLCFGANYFQTFESADRFASGLARRGYNAVRLHHHDGMLVKGQKDSVTLNPDRMRELDALVAALAKNGLYITTDVYVSRSVPWRELGIDRPGDVGMNEFKTLLRENEAAFSNLCAFAGNWLSHVNVHTGRRWADEPSVAWISFVNENCPDNFINGLDAKGVARQVGLENRFYARLADFLRNDVGAKQLFTDLNGWSVNPQWRPCRERFDYVDMHFYVDHPRFLEKDWRLPSECANEVPFAGGEPKGANWAGRCKVPEKPFTVTEWNFAAPGNYRSIGGIATGAWAAREDWDGLWRFAWSHSVDGVKNPCGQAMNYFDMSGDPLSLAGERASMCLFLRRDLASGDAAAFEIDGDKGPLRLSTGRTAGGFAMRGHISAGVFKADVGETPTTIWASSLDSAPLAQSCRILLTHLTDVQNTGARFADQSMKVLTDWGRLPHLMRRGKAKVSLSVSNGRFSVFSLNGDGTRRAEVPHSYTDGALSFTADVGRESGSASYLYEIVRR